jgi:hypothetical protein
MSGTHFYGFFVIGNRTGQIFFEVLQKPHIIVGDVQARVFRKSG